MFISSQAFFENDPVLVPLLDELPLGVSILDSHGRVIMVNRGYEILTGVDRHRVCGLGCLHALRCSHCLAGCPVRDGRTTFAPIHCDADVLTRDRRKVQVRLTVAPLVDESGHHRGYVETVQERIAPTRTDGYDHLPFGMDELVGVSPQFRRVLRMLPSVAQTDSSVLITGETGTGKDLLAEAIHKISDRARGPFVKINCGALPDTLLESELFGHAKGAFTGADRNKPGRFRLADKGTIFLTEIGDLPLALQVKLLSVLDDKMIYPLGGTTGFHADVRIIAATHRHLEDMVAQGRFRQDLLFRLNVIRLHVPPLKERIGDIPLLLDHFLKEFQARFKSRAQAFSDEALDLLRAYDYPGNIRELRNIVEYAVNFCPGETVSRRDLPAYLLSSAESAPLPPGPAGQTSQIPDGPLLTPKNDSTWTETERDMILEAMVRAKGRRGEAAKALGWARSTLWRKMREHGLSAP